MLKSFVRKTMSLARFLLGFSKSNQNNASNVFQEKKKPGKSRHVKFSPSTLQREISNNLTKLTSTEPYYNFLMAYNIKMKKKIYNMDLEDVSPGNIGHPSKTAFKLWCKLSIEEREPYYDMANKARLRQYKNFRNKKDLSVNRTVRLNGGKVNSQADQDEDTRTNITMTRAVPNSHLYGNDMGVHVLYKRGLINKDV